MEYVGKKVMHKVYGEGTIVQQETNYVQFDASAGTAFTHIATAENGWHAVVVGSRVGWVSGEFSKLE